MSRIVWDPVIERAAEIVASYETGVTLRQLFYRLVAAALIPNLDGAYKRLSSLTAQARRDGWFPALIDRGRPIHRYQTFDGSAQARQWLANIYRRDRTEGQRESIYVGVEKAGIVEQLQGWFADLGVSIISLGGYSSQTLIDDVAADVEAQRRPAVLIYAGDFDPSGEDIDRDFVARAGCFDSVERVALTVDQIDAYDLPPALGKAGDSRASQFVARHGRLIQVELDALPPDTLQSLYQTAIDSHWDTSTYDDVLGLEAAERAELRP